MGIKRIIGGKMFKRIFVVGSILFLSFMVFFYGYRLFYYYSAEHKKKIVVTLSDEIITNTDKLVEIEGDFYFQGTVENNYLYYAGIEYRIINFNKQYLTLIANEDLTKLKYGISSKYEESDIKRWLEEKYLETFNQELLYEKKVSLLDLETYLHIGGENSFLTFSDMWVVEDDKGLMLDKLGKINTPSSYQYFLGVRPIITIKNVDYIRGDGTLHNPYIIENKEATTLKDTSIGEYIQYKNSLYRIVSKDHGIRVVAVESVGKNKFSDNSIVYGASVPGDLYSYLNEAFLSRLNLEDLIITNWNIGSYQDTYKDIETKQVSSYVGLLTIGDYFIQDITGYLLSTSKESNTMIYTIQLDKSLYLTLPTKELDIYPSFSFHEELEISGGNGTKNYPYEVGV